MRMRILIPAVVLTALLVMNQVNAVEAPKEAPAGKPGAFQSTRTAFSGGTWTWVSTDASDTGTIQFNADGTASHGARNNAKWEATKNREITITHPDKGSATIRLSADAQSFKGTGYNGKPVSGKRMK